MQKIKAYTLMEVTVAMLLSAICISLCYTVFTLVNNYYANFNKDQNQISMLRLADHLLRKDFQEASLIKKTEGGITLTSGQGKIQYQFNSENIIRNQHGLRTDTLKLKPADVTMQYEGQEAELQEQVDELSFQLLNNQKEPIAMYYKKLYSAADLFK